SKYIDPKQKELNNIRKAPLHLIGLEGLLTATIVGGYFAAVLPKRWVGREQSYLRWWQQRAAIVARVELPRHWVTVMSRMVGEDGNGGALKQINMPGEWELVIWQRSNEYDKSTPNSHAHSINTRWVELRHPQFITKMTDVKENFPQEKVNEKIVEVIGHFQASEWWRLSVTNFNDFVENHSANPVYGTHAYRPHRLPKVEDTWLLDPAPQAQYHVRVHDDIRTITGVYDEQTRKWVIKPTPNAAHLTVTNKIKLRAYGTAGLPAAGLLLDFRTKYGIEMVDGDLNFNLDRDLRKRNYADFKEELIESLEKHGLAPCMTQADFDRVLKAERWLSLQLTPVERWIPVQKGKSADELSSDERGWELIYEDIGLEATYPEVLNLWRKRAKSIGLDRKDRTFEFQFDDIIVYCIKDSILNGNVMGLGKTRETLFGAILKGAKRFLIICPSKLIGVWQDEIRDTIAPFMERQRRNWNGDIFRCTL
ncbi:MAG TPA: hypothetical protein VJQ25_09660, partial [Nitrospira sp.]|nr:hypothetical protein [Nitrospira sp.]